MRKHILLISNPGDPGAENYCNGVKIDIENYVSYFTSPLGGAWYKTEITHLGRPTVNELTVTLNHLRGNDYLKIIFCGHGYHSAREMSTIFELKNKEEFDSMNLRGISPKQTIILDCCRKIEKDVLKEQRALDKFAKSFTELSSKDCRYYYEAELEKCPSGHVVVYGCNVDETAGDSGILGGYFTSSLLRASRNYHENSNCDIRTKYSHYSIVAAFNDAVPIVQRLSGNRQNPEIEKPRSTPYFPFAIIA